MNNSGLLFIDNSARRTKSCSKLRICKTTVALELQLVGLL